MHIAIIADSLDIQNAGVHVYTKNMIRSLQEQGIHKVTIFRLSSNTEDQYKNEIIVKRVIPFFQKDPLRLFFKLPSAIRRINPDIVIEPAHFGPFNLPVRIKRVTIIHDLTPILFPQWHSFISQKLQKIFLPSIIKKSSLIIANSDNTLNDIIHYYPSAKKKTIKIYPGIDPYFSTNNNFTEIKEPFFLNTGTIEPRKNLITLLNAYCIFRKKNNQKHKLIICGSKGWKNNEFYKKMDEHPYKEDIELRGYVDKETLKKLYETTTAFIYPSIYEGFGLPVTEAMSCGAPCIIARDSSLIEAGGIAAKYFNPGDADDLYERMKELTESKETRGQMIKKGIEHSQQFSWENYVSILEDELLKMM
ncbi:MAG: glycosyltransferase family 4 protein [Prolixibacteraceae bacterium]|nr:glycosyltransferase family 4 protein [Prolixibacteraceae bacterium]